MRSIATRNDEGLFGCTTSEERGIFCKLCADRIFQGYAKKPIEPPLQQVYSNPSLAGMSRDWKCVPHETLIPLDAQRMMGKVIDLCRSEFVGDKALSLGLNSNTFPFHLYFAIMNVGQESGASPMDASWSMLET